MARKIYAGLAGGETFAGIQGISPNTLRAKDDQDIVINAGGTGVLNVQSPLVVDNNDGLQLREATANGVNYVELKSPATVGTNLSLTLPGADGSNGQALITNGSGTLSFAAVGPSIDNNSNDSNQNYVTFINSTSGAATTIRITSSKVTFQPSTGTLTATAFSGDGSSLTNITAGALTTGNTYRVAALGVNTAAPGTGEVRATGNITAYYSDNRLKDFEGTIDGALDKVSALNGYYFRENEAAKALGYNNDARQVGVSAQEVEAILPEIVTDAPIENDQGYKTVYYDKLVPLLIEAIKELKAEVDALKG